MTRVYQGVQVNVQGKKIGLLGLCCALLVIVLESRLDELTLRTVERKDFLVTLADTGVRGNDIDATVRASADSVLEHGDLGIPRGDVAFDERMAGGKRLETDSLKLTNRLTSDFRKPS